MPLTYHPCSYRVTLPQTYQSCSYRVTRAAELPSLFGDFPAPSAACDVTRVTNGAIYVGIGSVYHDEGLSIGRSELQIRPETLIRGI